MDNRLGAECDDRGGTSAEAATSTHFCLVRPPAVESFRFATTSITVPLGIAYVAAAVEAAGYSVSVVDAVGQGPKVRTKYYKGYLVGLRTRDIVARIPAGVDLVGISVVFTHEWPIAVRLIDEIKASRPDLGICIGGEHVTAMPEFCLLTSRADYVVLGEGEESIIDLLDCLASDGKPDEIPGIGYRQADIVVINPRRPRRAAVDDIHPPAWRHIDLATYHENRFVGGMYTDALTVPVLATRGCPYQCTYCSAPNMWLPRWIPRDPVAVADEIEGYVKQFGARNFPFQDLTAIVRKDWIVQFCNEIINRKLDIIWQLPSGTRSEAIDSEVAALLARSGMVAMAYAPESGSETTRRYIKKKITDDKLFDSIKAAVSEDLNVSIFLVIGFPHDRPEHMTESLAFIDRLVTAGVTDLSVGFYMALPGTELFHSLYDTRQITFDRAYLRHILDSLALWPSQSYCSHLSRLALFKWKLRFYFRFYAAKQRARKATGGIVPSLRRAVAGLFSSGAHSSKLQTAFRNGMTSLYESIVARAGERWLPKADEHKMFATWNEIYGRVRAEKIRSGVIQPSPADTTELHRANVTKVLTADHSAKKTFAA